jgi:hypothetical protein
MNDVIAAMLGQVSTAPAPSLCDSCQHAYGLEGGTVSVGGATYPQRYCAVRRLALHLGGFNECADWTEKPKDSA